MTSDLCFTECKPYCNRRYLSLLEIFVHPTRPVCLTDSFCSVFGLFGGRWAAAYHGRPDCVRVDKEALLDSEGSEVKIVWSAKCFPSHSVGHSEIEEGVKGEIRVKGVAKLPCLC